MRRRDFVVGLLVAATGRAQAQQPGKMYRIASVAAAGSLLSSGRLGRGGGGLRAADPYLAQRERLYEGMRKAGLPEE
jgi:parvulin-like peptidyl-prolyl isomerase